MATTYTRRDMVAAAEVGRSRAEEKAATAVRRATARYDKLREQGDELMAETMRGAAVSGVAFAAGWARGRYGDERMTMMGLPLEALVGVGGHVAALAMRSGSSPSSKRFAPLAHSAANGALAAWLTQEGRTMGARMRTESATASGYYPPADYPALPAPAQPYALPAPVAAPGYIASGHAPRAVAGATPAADHALAEAIAVMSQSLHGEEAA